MRPEAEDLPRLKPRILQGNGGRDVDRVCDDKENSIGRYLADGSGGLCDNLCVLEDEVVSVLARLAGHPCCTDNNIRVSCIGKAGAV